MRGLQCYIIQLCPLTLTLSLMERGLLSHQSGRIALKKGIKKQLTADERRYTQINQRPVKIFG